MPITRFRCGGVVAWHRVAPEYSAGIVAIEANNSDAIRLSIEGVWLRGFCISTLVISR